MDFPEPGGPITSCAKGIFFFFLSFGLFWGLVVGCLAGGRIVEVGWVCLSDAWVTRLVVVRVGAMLILIGGHSGYDFGVGGSIIYYPGVAELAYTRVRQEAFDIRGRELVWALRYARVFCHTP